MSTTDLSGPKAALTSVTAPLIIFSVPGGRTRDGARRQRPWRLITISSSKPPTMAKCSRLVVNSRRA
jgi:hypothetical protein